jgi:hypothetical protein
MPPSEDPPSQPLWQPTPIDGAAIVEPGPINYPPSPFQAMLEEVLQLSRQLRQTLQEEKDQDRQAEATASQQIGDQMQQAAAETLAAMEARAQQLKQTAQQQGVVGATTPMVNPEGGKQPTQPATPDRTVELIVAIVETQTQLARQAIEATNAARQHPLPPGATPPSLG